MQHVGRRRKWPQRPVESLQEWTENLFLATDPRRLAELSDLDTPAVPAAMKLATLFWVEWGIAGWVGDANRRKGVAPSTEALLQELERRRLQLPEAARFPSRGGSSENKARVWAFQWRRRWGARHCRVRVREDISVAKMRAKAFLFSGGVIFMNPRVYKLGRFSPRFLHRFGGRQLVLMLYCMFSQLSGGPGSVPAAGPKSGAVCLCFQIVFCPAFASRRPWRLGSGSIICRVEFRTVRRC